MQKVECRKNGGAPGAEARGPTEAGAHLVGGRGAMGDMGDLHVNPLPIDFAVM